jgi:DNA-directed RNA polymerase specialized sigma24 family protein
MSPLSLRRYRAERLLRRDFDGLRSTVLRAVSGRLAARGVRLESIDLEACYAQAWQGLYATVLSGEEVANPTGWLVLVSFRRAIEDHRRGAGAQGLRPLDDVAVGQGGHELDYAGRLDDLQRLRHVFEALRLRLTGRECEAASLCYLQGLSRAEAAARMGISQRRMGKLMDGDGPGRPGVAAKVGELLGVIRGNAWCEEQASLMRGLAFGLLDPGGERHRLALAHQRQCSACRAYVASLRGLAAVLPPLGLPAGLVAGATSGVAGATGAGVASGAGAAGVAGAGGAMTGGGWLMAGGSLSAKVAASCLLALGVGVGCVAITASPKRSGRAALARHHGRARAQTARAAPAAPEARPTLAAAPGAHSPGRGTHTAPAPARSLAVRSSSVATAAEPAARREFGLESAAARSAPVARSASVAGAAGVTSRAPPGHARREFGFE